MTSLLSRNSPFRIFIFSCVVSLVVLGTVLIYLGWQAALVALVLIIIELTFSFDNAIINARVLATMSVFWRRMFMSVGIIIAVFGMRIIFPILIVMFTARLSWGHVIQLALEQPDKYAMMLARAHPSIASFGGMFLLMLSLDFFFDSSRKILWLNRLEQAMQYVGQKWLHVAVSFCTLLLIVALPSNHHAGEVLAAGGVGIMAFILINGSFKLLAVMRARNSGKAAKKAALAGLASFIYLETLDASFSFDGVIGAFAVTQDVVLIAVGLGVGALWVRSLTLFIVHKRTLATYRYLEHGAHYVIGILAAILLIGLFYDIPAMTAGIIGLVVIGAATFSSVRDNKKDAVQVKL